jgi:hypothetical protein
MLAARRYGRSLIISGGGAKDDGGASAGQREDDVKVFCVEKFGATILQPLRARAIGPGDGHRRHLGLRREVWRQTVDCLTKDRDALLAFYAFPAEHWDHLRTANPTESLCTVRHRIVRTKGALSHKKPPGS